MKCENCRGERADGLFLVAYFGKSYFLCAPCVDRHVANSGEVTLVKPQGKHDGRLLSEAWDEVEAKVIEVGGGD